MEINKDSNHSEKSEIIDIHQIIKEEPEVEINSQIDRAIVEPPVLEYPQRKGSVGLPNNHSQFKPAKLHPQLHNVDKSKKKQKDSDALALSDGYSPTDSKNFFL